MPTVLVVDDSAIDRRLVGRLLAGDEELRLDYAESGTSALEAIDRQLPDVVVTDLVMPGMDGLALVSACKDRYPLLPVIILTSKGNEETAVRALEHGAASYVPKRLMVSALRETIRQVLAAASHRRDLSQLMQCLVRTEHTFELHNNARLIAPLIAYVEDSLLRTGLCTPGESVRISIALHEALANALYHGNLELGSELREQDPQAFHELAERRASEPPYRDRRLAIEARLSPLEAVIVIRDQGPGFDPTRVANPTDEGNLERISGRGLLLMRTFLDEVAFNATGNEVTLVKRRSAEQPATL